MALRGSFTPYRRRLTWRARVLRRNPTPAERKLWIQFLRDLPAKFTRQKPLGDYIADFYCAQGRLVIEIDGDSHFSATGAARDGARTAFLEKVGLKVLRFTNEDVTQRFEAVCLEIAASLENLTPRSPSAHDPLDRG
jgi:very-short-patch-repair endonuclease